MKKFKHGEITELHTDASDVGIGAALVQIVKGEERPIGFYSRKLQASEKNYPVIKKEFLAVNEALKFFHPYIHGHPFKVLTDHKPLIGLVRSGGDRDNLVNRWIMNFATYDAVLQYRKGELNGNADALSRLPQVNAIHIPGLEWNQAQVQDAECRKLQENISKLKDVRLIRGVLYKMIGTKKRLLVPQVWRNKVINEGHNGHFGGHFGAAKTYWTLQKHYFWEGMWKDVKAFCDACDVCLQKKKSKMDHGIPANIEIGGPWETIALDIVGPYNESSSGNKFLLVAIDMFTKNVEVIATPSTTADVIVKFLADEVCFRHGVPRYILTDNGRNFLAEAVSRFYQSMGIKRKTSSPYNPQGNGIVERFNGTLTKLIRLSCGGDPQYREWDKHLTACLFAYRKTPHETTGESPFFLDHGREPILPLESLAETVEMDTNTWRQMILKNLDTAWNVAQRRIEKAALSRNERLESTQPATVFDIDDLVYYHEEQRQGSSKLYWAWKGPARVIMKFNHNTYNIKDLETGVEYHRVNIRRLRKMNHIISRVHHNQDSVYAPWSIASGQAENSERETTVPSYEGNVIQQQDHRATWPRSPAKTGTRSETRKGTPVELHIDPTRQPSSSVAALLPPKPVNEEQRQSQSDSNPKVDEHELQENPKVSEFRRQVQNVLRDAGQQKVKPCNLEGLKFRMRSDFQFDELRKAFRETPDNRPQAIGQVLQGIRESDLKNLDP